MDKAIAIFDIGKTNKKFFLFNYSFEILKQESIRFDETTDADGFPSEDLKKLVHWVRTTFDKYNQSDRYQITHLNFSTYGASLVYLNEIGIDTGLFYNYLNQNS
ncbi:MAG: hypothetical protein AAFQ94_04720 [Bacteroidota bacterium]